VRQVEKHILVLSCLPATNGIRTTLPCGKTYSERYQAIFILVNSVSTRT